MLTQTREQIPEHKTFSRPDEVREFPSGRLELITVGGCQIGRLILKPGWRWSNDVRPIANTEYCEAPHFQYHAAGRIAVKMEDGTEFLAGPGDVTSLPRGHDAWVIGDEPVVLVDWFGASNYAKPAGEEDVTAARVTIDCATFPSETGCTLKISGTEDEVLKAARDHAIASHGHHDSPELVEALRQALIGA